MPNLQDVPAGLSVTEHLSLERCPHCSTAKPTLQREHTFEATPLAGSHAVPFNYLWYVYTCKSCAGIVCAACVNFPNPRTSRTSHSTGEVMWLVPGVQSWDTAIPRRSASYLRQATETISSPSASIMTSASAVDAMLKELGLKEGKLYSRIEAAVQKGLITSEMGAWAHDVRLDANDERHVDDSAAEPVSADAERCLEFARTLADILFVLPARVRRGRGQAPTKT